MKVPPKYSDDRIFGTITRVLKLLEDHNKVKYVTPNSNYVHLITGNPDLLKFYSDEIQVLRQIVCDAALLCTDIRSHAISKPTMIYKHPDVLKILTYATIQPWYNPTISVDATPRKP